MEYRHLGNTGMRVSEISLGSWLTYGGYVARERAVQSIHTAYELGINFFDTANTYERGEAEKVVGEILRNYPRESYVLATKVWGVMGDGPNDRGLSRKHIMEQCHASLKRLGMDYVDLYYCHRYDETTPLEETLRAMDDLVRQGKVLYVGVSAWTPAQIMEALHLADKKLLDRLVVNQPLYNMLDRSIEEEVIPVCSEHGVGQVVYSPLAQGILSGKYKKGADIPKSSRAANLNDPKWNKLFSGDFEDDTSLDRVARLLEVAEQEGLTMSQLSLAWVLRQSNVSSALIGASRPEQVEENVKAAGVTLSPEALQQIEEILQ